MSHVKNEIYDSIVSQLELKLKRATLLLGNIVDNPSNIITKDAELNLKEFNNYLDNCIRIKEKVDFLKANRNYLVEVSSFTDNEKRNTNDNTIIKNEKIKVNHTNNKNKISEKNAIDLTIKTENNN